MQFLEQATEASPVLIIQKSSVMLCSGKTFDNPNETTGNAMGQRRSIVSDIDGLRYPFKLAEYLCAGFLIHLVERQCDQPRLKLSIGESPEIPRICMDVAEGIVPPLICPFL
jgi:hypothetical protein